MENKELQIDYNEFLNAVLDGKCVMFVDSSSTAKNIKFTPVIYTNYGIRNVWFLFKRLGFRLDLGNLLVVCPRKYVMNKNSIMEEFFKSCKGGRFGRSNRQRFLLLSRARILS